MKKILIVTATCVALYAGLASPSIADETLTSKSGAGIETTVADLERRIGQLEAKIGGETVKSAFNPRSSRVQYLTVPSQASNPD